METVHIDTTQNVRLLLPVATIVDRGVAILLDWIILIGYSVILSNVQDVTGRFPDWLEIVLFLFPWIFYVLVLELLMDGQTIGKRVMKIKVMRLDGGPASLGDYLLRELLRPVDTLFFIGSVVILLNGRGQRLGDLAAGTTVVSLKQRVQLVDTLNDQLALDHQVRHPSAVRLSDEQARLLKKVVADRSAQRMIMQARMASRLREQLGIADDNKPPEAFLRDLLNDYVYLTRG